MIKVILSNYFIKKHFFFSKISLYKQTQYDLGIPGSVWNI